MQVNMDDLKRQAAARALEQVRDGMKLGLGTGSTACNLDPSGLAKACEAVERDIEEGADVVVLSKFGKLEAARGGLCDAFRAAILADLPIITTVSPLLADEWSQFAGLLSNKVPATMDALGAWWTAHGSVTN